MPFARPPARLPGAPSPRVIPAGTRLWRVHGKKYQSHLFNPSARDEHFGGGRFDSTPSQPYPFFYAGLTDLTAIAETFLRGLPFADRRKRTLQRELLRDRRLSAVELTADLRLLALVSTTDLAAVGQDEWLVQAEAKEYGATRRWAHWLRDQVDWAQGLVWQSKRNLPELAVVLFGDRCAGDALRRLPDDGIDLDGPDGARWLNQVLAPYLVAVRPPVSSRAVLPGPSRDASR